jgi:Zn-dependent M28 family amino/carboxypeptidase
MLGMPDELAGGVGKVWLTGFERTNLGPLFVSAGFDVGPDMRPEQNFFERSDNIVFVKKGIVGQTLSTGGDNPNYHQVTDEVHTLDFEHMRRCGQAALEAARLLTSGQVTPAWNEGEPKLGRR